MANFLVAADLHLNLNMWNTNKAIRFDSLFSFYSVLAIAQELKEPIILAGDIFDEKKITSELFLYVKAIRDEFKDVDIYYVNGNHDCSDPGWLEHIGAKHLTEQGTIIDGVTVCGLDYSLSDDFRNKLERVYPYADVLITHQTYDCFFNSPSAIDHKLLTGKHLVLSGDYHKHCQYIMSKEDANNGKLIIHDNCYDAHQFDEANDDLIVSIGSATMCSVIEDTPCMVHVEAYERGRENRVRRWEVPHRLVYRMSNLAEYTDVQLISGLPQSPVVRDGALRYKGVSYNDFMDIITRAARKMNAPRPIYSSSLGIMFIARTKAELERAQNITNELKYGYVLYAPLMIKPDQDSETSEAVPTTRDSITEYMTRVAQEYPCDSAVSQALIDYLTTDTVDFLENEAKRFGYNEEG